MVITISIAARVPFVLNLLSLCFQKNAKAPLSSLYDNSPLEQMHCTLLLHILRRQGLGFLLDNPRSGAQFRKLLSETVLATDMRVHLDFMIRFKRIVDGEQVDLEKKKVLVCQALIKCADISNPVRIALCVRCSAWCEI